MARYTGPKEKIERRLGTKLFLKGERSYSPKSATVKRMYPPGVHGKNFQRRLSEFGLQLRSKQKIRNTYRLMEKQFKNLVKKSIAARDETGDFLLKKLEQRLDNVVFRAGFAQSRDQARQIVNHGHITVNGKRTKIPSHEVRLNDLIGVRDGSKKMKFFSALVFQWLQKHEPPKWIDLKTNNLEAKIISLPNPNDCGIDHKDIQAIIEYYSR